MHVCRVPMRERVRSSSEKQIKKGENERMYISIEETETHA